MGQDIQRLGAYVEARRKELGLSQKDLGTRGGPSDTTVSKVELGRAKRILAKTARELDLALGWNPGSSESIMAGGEPSAPARSGLLLPGPTMPPGDEIDLRSTSVGKDANGNMELSIDGLAGTSRLTITYRTGSPLRTLRTMDLVEVFGATYRHLLSRTLEVSSSAEAWDVGTVAAGQQFRTSVSAHTTTLTSSGGPEAAGGSDADPAPGSGGQVLRMPADLAAAGAADPVDPLDNPHVLPTAARKRRDRSREV